MKKTLTILTLGLALVLAAALGLGTLQGSDSVDLEATATTAALVLNSNQIDLDPLGLNATQSFYPNCRIYAGKYCSTPGSLAWCQWQYGEPEVCDCQSNNRWRCGSIS